MNKEYTKKEKSHELKRLIKNKNKGYGQKKVYTERRT